MIMNISEFKAKYFAAFKIRPTYSCYYSYVFSYIQPHKEKIKSLRSLLFPKSRYGECLKALDPTDKTRTSATIEVRYKKPYYLIYDLWNDGLILGLTEVQCNPWLYKLDKDGNEKYYEPLDNIVIE